MINRKTKNSRDINLDGEVTFMPKENILKRFNREAENRVI